MKEYVDIMQTTQIKTDVTDISETDFREQYRDVLDVLLYDHTTRKNIFWATNDYNNLGDNFTYQAEIKQNLITGKYGKVIRPRIWKDKDCQLTRIRDMAEVFTPSWICNMQNNLVDAAWFERKNVFNTEVSDSNSAFRWTATPDKIAFPEGKSWQDYVALNRMEITCGEAPYITSRYDTTTGTFIPLEQRIGILDRKLRIVNENTDNSKDWLKYAQKAFCSTYAYEWQGDSLLLAREAMLFAFIENYQHKFGHLPQEKSIRYIAYIISWNVWQMDGLKGTVPDTCHETQPDDWFGNIPAEPCPGCIHGDIHRHNGIYCLIKDWSAGKKIEYISLLKGK